MHRRSELSTASALWIFLVQRPRPRLKHKRQRWWIRVWWWPFVLWAPAGWVLVVYEWGRDPHAGAGLAGVIFSTLLEVALLALWWDDSRDVRRANSRRRECSWALLEKRIAALEAELGFGEYDTIAAIEWLKVARPGHQPLYVTRAERKVETWPEAFGVPREAPARKGVVHHDG
jgi:hypothetical protein